MRTPFFGKARGTTLALLRYFFGGRPRELAGDNHFNVASQVKGTESHLIHNSHEKSRTTGVSPFLIQANLALFIGKRRLIAKWHAASLVTCIGFRCHQVWASATINEQLVGFRSDRMQILLFLKQTKAFGHSTAGDGKAMTGTGLAHETHQHCTKNHTTTPQPSRWEGSSQVNFDERM